MLSSVKPGKSHSRDRCPNLIADFSSSLFLQDPVALHSQNVIDATDAKTFAQESKFCLRVLTQLDTFVHSSDDVRLGQELVRDQLSRSYSDSPSVTPPTVTVETVAMFCTPPSLHSGGAAPRSSTW